MSTRATGTLQDNQKRSYVESPTRTGDTAQEVHVGNEVTSNQADYRLMISYQSKILEQLEKLNTYMEILTDEEI